MNPLQVAKQLMSEKGRNELANQMLSKLPQDTRDYLLKYKNNPMKGIEEGVRNGKISEKEISQLRPLVEKARMFGVRIPINKLNEIEQLAKQNQKNNGNTFSIF